MLMLLWFILSLGFGWCLLQWLPFTLTKAESAAAGAVIGMLGVSWLSFLGGWLIGFPITLWLLTGLQLVVIILSLLRRGKWALRFEKTEWPGGTLAQLVQVALLTLGVSFFLYLASSHTLHIQADGWYGRGYTWSDLPFHMSLMSNVAYQPYFKFIFPVYYVGKLSYPFLADIFPGMLLRLSPDWPLAIFLQTATLFLAFMQLFLSVSRRLLGSIRAAWLHLFLFCCSGSAWGLFLYFQDAHTQGWRIFENYDYSNLEQAQQLFFANSLTASLLPQRGFLFGFVIALLLILFLLDRRNSWSVWCSGLLVGLTPFVHVHTFFVLFGLLVLLGLEEGIRQKTWRVSWLPALGLSAVLALPQLGWQFFAAYHTNFGYWYLGWARSADSSVLLFLLRNFGIILLFVFLNLWVARRYFARNALVRVINVLSLLIFLVVEVRIFQPNPFDNMKFLLYGYWGITLLAAYLLARWSRSWYGALVSLLIVLLMTGTGMLVLARETTASWMEMSTDEVQFAQDFRGIVPVDANVLTTIRHNHPVPLLTGRRILLGYTGWLWSYGIDVTSLQAAVEEIWVGTPQTATWLHYYHVQYVAFSEAEVFTQPVNLAYFEQNETLVYHAHGWYIFQVR